MEGDIVSHISPSLFHIITKKTVAEWFWKKYYSLFTFTIPTMIDYSERPVHKNIIHEICNKGWAAHMVKWDGTNYTVDLTSLATYSDKYGCLLTLNDKLEPIELRCRNMTLDSSLPVAVNIFLKSCLVKTLLIDNVLANRFIFCDNLMVSIKKHPELHKDLQSLILPYLLPIINSNQFIYDYCMGESAGLFEQIFEFPEYRKYISNEYDFCIWSPPKELFTNNIENLTMPSKIPVWYIKATTYWDVIEIFVGKWVNIFLNSVSCDECRIIEDWLTEFFGIFLDLTESLKDVLCRLIWITTFYQRHVSLQGLYIMKGLPSSANKPPGLPYYASMTENLKIELAKPDFKYQDIWIEFEEIQKEFLL